MSPERFNHLVDLLRPLITKEVRCRIPISVEERLAVTLRYLATGNSQRDLAFSFKLGRSTINQIFTEVCISLWDVLSEYVSPFSSPEDWKRISNDFCQIWNMPHCIGAIDGKHVCIRQPSHTGTLLHNYKGFVSMVLLAVCDARYSFSFADVGEYGSNNGSGVLNIGKMFDRNQMDVPDSELIEGTNYELPYRLVGDEIFPLQNWLMRPYSGKALINDQQKIFNYRLSRARRIIENTFRILVSRWRVFQTPINATPEKVEKIILAAVALHNYLRQTDNANYTPVGFVDSENDSGEITEGQWRSKIDGNILQPVNRVRNSRYTNTALQTGQELSKFLMNEGSVSWQLKYIKRTGAE